MTFSTATQTKCTSGLKVTQELIDRVLAKARLKQIAASLPGPFSVIEDELLPNCPLCGEHNPVTLSSCPDEGAYFCGDCREWFSNTESAEEVSQGVPAPSFRDDFEARFPTLCFEFIERMNEIGMLGRNKYGDNAVENRCKRGDYSRAPRIFRREIAEHARNHFAEYIDGVRHDVYGTVEHQLAAAAFNPMMEFLLSGLHERRAK